MGMKQFFDSYGHTVELSFSKNTFEEKAKHVFVICQYRDAWLLTKHKSRGLEFPGGKVEAGESLEDAARREVFEETGAILKEIKQFAEYRVTSDKESFVKVIFWGKVKDIRKTNQYYETEGPVLVTGDLLEQRFGNEYSFIMKDQVIEECINFLKLQKE